MNEPFSILQTARNFQTVATELGTPLGAVRPRPGPAVPVGRPVFAPPAQPSSIYGGHQPETHLGLGSKLDKSGRMWRDVGASLTKGHRNQSVWHSEWCVVFAHETHAYSFWGHVGLIESSYPIFEYPLVMTNSLLLKMAIELVDFPIKNGGSFHSFLYVYQRVYPIKSH